MNELENATAIDEEDFTPEYKIPKAPSALQLIAWLSATDAISKDERDAAELVARLASFVYERPAADGAAHIPLRDGEGKWSNQLLRGQEIKAKLKALLAAPKNDSRQRAVRLALVSREREQNWQDTSALSCGLDDIAKHLWPRAAAETINRNGVTLAKTAANDNEPQDATAERLAQAGDDWELRDGVRVVNDSPFERMKLRGQLDANEEINEILYSAGRNYHQNWYYGGLGGLAAIDYSRVSGGGGDTDPSHGMPTSEFAAQHRHKFRKARERLPKRYLEIVDAIILEEKSIADIAGDVTAYKDPVSARAVTKERFLVALQLLAGFYGLLARTTKAA